MKRARALALLASVCATAVSPAGERGLGVAQSTFVPSTLGAFDAATWFLDRNGNVGFDPATEVTGWGTPTSVPVVGDWNGDGHDELGVFADGIWFLDINGDGAFDPATEVKPWGVAGWTPAPGDWNGDGKTDLGIVAPDSTWFRDVNGNFAFEPATEILGWGVPGSIPVPADWNGDGKDEVGVFINGTWFIDFDGDEMFTNFVEVRGWGSPGWTPAVGDWDGDGVADLGAISPDFIWFRDMDGNNGFNELKEIHGWGFAGATPIIQDWDGDGRDQIGVFAGGAWFVDFNGNNQFEAVSEIVYWGTASSRPVPGRWSVPVPAGGPVDPPDGQLAVPTNRRIIVRLPSPVDPATVNASTVQLKQGASFVPASLVLSFDKRFLSIRPTAPFAPLTEYTVVITGLMAPGGAPLLGPLTSKFRTSAGPDTALFYHLVDGPFPVPTNASLYLPFTAPIDPTTFDPSTWFLREAASGTVMPLTCTLSATWEAVSCALTEPLWVGAMHEIHGSGIESVNGVPRNSQGTQVGSLTAGYSADTTPPQVLGAAPPPGFVGYPGGEDIVVLLSERVSTIGPGTRIALEENGYSVPIQVRQGPPDEGPRLILRPDAPLLPSKQFRIVLENVRDLAGNLMASQFYSTFTTGPPDSISTSAAASPSIATSVPLNTVFRITFLNDVVPASITPQTIALNGPHGPVEATRVLTASNRVTLTPNADLEPFAEYRLELGKGLLSVHGWSISFLKTFTTGAVADHTPPSVLSASPPNGSTGVPSNAKAMIVLSEGIDSTSVTPQTARVTGTNLPLQLIGDTVLSLPVGVSLNGTGFDLNGLRDYAGNPLPRFVSTFQKNGPASIQGPTLVSSTPAQGATGVALGQTISLQFDKPLAPHTVSSASVLLYMLRGGALLPIPANVSLAGSSTVQMTVPSGLLPNTTYTVNLVGGAGNPADYAGFLVSGFTPLSFTTGSGPVDQTPPTILSVSPSDGATYETEVSNNTVIYVELAFSEPINPNTLTSDTVFYLSNGISHQPSAIEVFDNSQKARVRLSGMDAIQEGPLTVILSTGVQDYSGNGLASDFVSQFDVVEPEQSSASNFAIQESRPKPFASGLPAATKLSFLTSQPFSSSNLDQALYVVLNGKLVSGTIDALAGNRILRFTPDQPFPLGSTVQFTPRPEWTSEDGGEPILNNLFQDSVFIRPDPQANPPQVIAASPNVPVRLLETPKGNTSNSRILVRFTEPLNPATVNTSTVSLTANNPNPTPIAGTVGLTAGGDTIEFFPAAPLPVGWSHDLIITTGVQDLQGQALPQGFLYSFTVWDGPDTTPPGVRAVSPPDGLTGVPLNARIRLSFSEAVNPVTVRESTVRLFRNGQQQAVAELSISTAQDQITLIPLEYLEPNTSYTASASGLEDAAGNPVAPKTWTFTTGDKVDTERITRLYGLSGAAGITYVYDEPFDPTGIPIDFLQDPGGNPIPGTLVFSADGRSFTFTPSVALTPNVTYHASLDLTDLAGNMGSGSQLNVTPSLTPDVQPPAVTSVAPANGATNVSPFAAVTITWDEALSTATANEQTVQILDGATPVPVRIESSAFTTKVYPLAGFPLGKTLTIQLAGIQDASGNQAPASSPGSFTIRNAYDFRAPLYITNANRSVGVPRDVTITIFFDEPVDPASVTPSTVYFASGAPLPSQPVVQPGGQFVKLSPASPLGVNQNIEVIVSGVTDMAGNLAQPHSGFNIFTTGADLTDTGPPAITRFLPADGATNVPRSVIVDALLSEPLDPFSYQGDFLEVRDSNGSLVAARRPLVFQPPLPANATFTIHTKAAMDYAGKPLAAQTATFTTGAGSDTVKPQITSQYPATNSTGIPVDVVVVIDFDEPIVASNIDMQFTNPFRDIPVSWTLTQNFQRLTIQPLEILAPGSYHGVRMFIGDLSGNSFGSTQGFYGFGFTTAGTSLTEAGDALQVVHVNPPAGAEIAGGAVTLTLSEPLDPASLGNVFLASNDPRAANARAALLGDGATLEIELPAGLESGPVSAGLTSGTRAASGARAAAFEGRFAYSSDAKARLTELRPPVGAAEVAQDARIYATFSEPLDPLSVAASVEVLADEAFVTGEIALAEDGRTIVFSPDLLFRLGAKVLVRVRQDMLRTEDGGRFADWPHETFFAVGERASSALAFGRPIEGDVAVWPQDGAAEIEPLAEARIEIPGRPQASMLGAFVLICTDTGAIVPSRAAVKATETGSAVTLTPHQPLEPGASYAVWADPGSRSSRQLSTFSTK